MDKTVTGAQGFMRLVHQPASLGVEEGEAIVLTLENAPNFKSRTRPTPRELGYPH